jgi:LacI family transcriptional regulator
MVADSAGVSIATVSKVLNSRSDVAPSTRALVWRFLREHDYMPPSTRSIGSVARRPVELIFDRTLEAYELEVIQGVTGGGSEAGVAIVVSVQPRLSGADHSEAWVRDLAAGRQGVIAVFDAVTHAQFTAFEQAQLPLVVLDPQHLPTTEVTSVGSTNFAGGFAASQHLLGLGHRGIAYLGGPATASCNQARMHGFLAAMESRQVPVPASYLRAGSFTYRDGLAGGAALLDLATRPTAIFAGSDAIAMGVVEAARLRGLRVPDDLSVVGFDDTLLAQTASPGLTTVRQPLQDMGRVALRTVLQLAAAEQLDSHHVELATELVVRGSTAAPARR